jgi:hypothetical protein
MPSPRTPGVGQPRQGLGVMPRVECSRVASRRLETSRNGRRVDSRGAGSVADGARDRGARSASTVQQDRRAQAAPENGVNGDDHTKAARGTMRGSDFVITDMTSIPTDPSMTARPDACFPSCPRVRPGLRCGAGTGAGQEAKPAAPAPTFRRQRMRGSGNCELADRGLPSSTTTRRRFAGVSCIQGAVVRRQAPRSAARAAKRSCSAGRS